MVGREPPVVDGAPHRAAAGLMHESARRGLVRLLRGVAVLAAVLVAALLVVRGCRSETERLSDAIDDAREALDERRRDDVLTFIAQDVAYRGSGDRKAFEAGLDQWIERRAFRASIVERTIEMAPGETSARVRLVVDVTAVFQHLRRVTVDIDAEKRDGAWQAVRFAWE